MSLTGDEARVVVGILGKASETRSNPNLDDSLGKDSRP